LPQEPRRSTKEESLAKAKEVAEDWYLQLRGKLRNGEIKTERTFRDASDSSSRNTPSSRRASGTRLCERPAPSLSPPSEPFFGDMGLSEVTSGAIQEYRIHRLQKAMKERGKAPARNTMHMEIVTSARPQNSPSSRWLDRLPDMSEPYRASQNLHRAWFSGGIQAALRSHPKTRAASEEPALQVGVRTASRLRLVHGEYGLRPDEVKRLQFRDVSIVEDGRRGKPSSKSRSAVNRDRLLQKHDRRRAPFQRLKARNVARAAAKALRRAATGRQPGGTANSEARE